MFYSETIPANKKFAEDEYCYVFNSQKYPLLAYKIVLIYAGEFSDSVAMITS